MTVFLAALDEAQNDAGDFVMGGWIAPLEDWTRYVEPAWKERVLEGGKRPIPYLHMSEIWGSDFQEKHGISSSEAYWAVEEAASVIYSTGSLYPFATEVTMQDFKSLLVDRLAPIGGFGEYIEAPDYTCFILLSLLAMKYVQTRFPDATRVDLLVEKSDRTSEKIKGFQGHIDGFLPTYAELLPIRGNLRVEDKTSIPAQVADMLLWHVQRHHAGRLKRRDEQRRFWMLTNRHGISFDHDPEYLKAMAERLAQEMLRRRAAGET